MSQFANAFRVAIGDQITHIVAKSVNLEAEREIIVSDLALQTPDALSLAHLIIKLHAEHAEKVIAGQLAETVQ